MMICKADCHFAIGFYCVGFIQVVHSAEAALLRCGLQSGVVVDMGLGVTRATPVVDGAVTQHAVQTQFIGENLTGTICCAQRHCIALYQ